MEHSSDPTSSPEQPATVNNHFNWSTSISVKIVAIVLLIALLMIPTSFIQSLIDERQSWQQQAIQEVTDKWGREQVINGPVLTIPYKIISETDGRERTEFIRLLPEKLNINGDLNPETRYRGIFEVIVYNAQLNVSGTFPAFSDPAIKPEHIQWQDAFLSVGITDLRGIREMLKLDWNGQSFSPEPGIPSGGISTSGMSCKVPVADSVSNNFSFTLSLNGSNSVHFVPLGKETQVDIHSTWSNPSFSGAFLPVERDINKDGFTATWKALYLNRNFPQVWLGSATHDVLSSSFGVGLLVPVEQYQKSIRSVKYALMFICLTFLFFFLVEIINHRNIHPVQYALVGLALCLFYTLLVALSEHIGFNKAYLISSVGIIGMITVYSRYVFRKNLLTFVMGLVLIALYGFLFTTLQLQDYALLIGSVGLFVILGLVMFLSRNIDWYVMKRQVS